ncbi:MAG: GGDEF domain-containing protein [Anaerolineae bacterium]|nr:GGDEF domain-containing protein [Anaerolineae bacterium]
MNINLGVSSKNGQDDLLTINMMFERADQALYNAKRASRNRVMVWSVPLNKPRKRAEQDAGSSI